MWQLAPRQLSETEHPIDRRVRRIDRGVSVVSSNSAGIRRLFLFVLSIEGVCSELVQTLCFRFSRERVARVSTGHFTDIRVMRCLVKTSLQAP